MSPTVELEEYVSDYVAMCRMNGDALPGAREIAIGYVDATTTGLSLPEFRARVDALVSQIEYYLP